jgi:hypothetical protein
MTKRGGKLAGKKSKDWSKEVLHEAPFL